MRLRFAGIELKCGAVTRWNVIIKAVLVLALVWTGVWAVRAYADSRKNTAERVGREIEKAAFADWSDRSTLPESPETQRRDKKLREIANLVNLLDFQEREAHRRNRTDAAFFSKLNPQEKGRYIELTVMESIKRFIASLDGMPPKQRKQFIEQGLKEFAQGSSEEELARTKALGADMLTKISIEGMRAYLGKSSADAKLNLAPLIEVVNETMQGLRGNEFGPRHER